MKQEGPNSQPERFVIVGGGTAGWLAAARQHVRSVEEMRVAKPKTVANIGHSLGTKVMG